MRRREFINVFVASAAAWPLSLHAQQRKVPRVGVLLLGTPQAMAGRLAALRKGLEERGYVGGNNISLEVRWGEGRYNHLHALAAELVRSGVDVLVTHGTPGVRAAIAITATTPIVAITGDALATQLIDGLSRPGRNLTGLTFLSTELNAKRLEIVKDALPNVTRIAMLLNASNSISNLVFQTVDGRAAAMRLSLRRYDFRDPSDLSARFSAMRKDGIEALITNEDPLVVSNAKPIADLALKHKIALVAGSDLVNAGGLLSYAVNIPELFRRTAAFIDKILKGVPVTDLPVELPTKFELTINLRTAKTLGISVPPTFVARADAVID